MRTHAGKPQWISNPLPVCCVECTEDGTSFISSLLRCTYSASTSTSTCSSPFEKNHLRTASHQICLRVRLSSRRKMMVCFSTPNDILPSYLCVGCNDYTQVTHKTTEQTTTRNTDSYDSYTDFALVITLEYNSS